MRKYIIVGWLLSFVWGYIIGSQKMSTLAGVLITVVGTTVIMLAMFYFGSLRNPSTTEKKP